MKEKSVIKYIIFLSLLMFFSSCQKKYGYIKKVRVHAKNIAKEATPRQKLKAITLVQKKPPILIVETNNSINNSIFLPTLEPKNSKAKAHNLTAKWQDTTYKPVQKTPPALEDVKLNKSNYLEVLYLAVIFLAVLTFAFFSLIGIGLIVSIVTSLITGIIIVEETVVFISIFGIIFIPLAIFIASYFFRLLQKLTVTYDNTKYTVAEIENMPASIRAKRTLHNITAWFVLLIPVFAVTIFTGLGIGFLPLLVYLLVKMIVLFLKKNKEEKSPVD